MTTDSPIYFITLALDAMPWITNHLPMMNRLKVNWRWVIIEGVSKPVRDTSWCKEIPPRLSEDGTSEYLQNIASNPRISIIQKKEWYGKTAMINHALTFCTKPGLVWQLDSDEIWQAEDVEKVYQAFQDNPKKNCARFHARYFLGQNIVITSENAYGNHSWEWMRVWRYFPGMTFLKHEPPVFMPFVENAFSKKETLAMGVKFDHYAYAMVDQVVFKQTFYNYPGAVDQWIALQKNTVWPTKVSKFLKWVKDDAVCDLLYR